MLEDLETIISKLVSGSMFFVSFNSSDQKSSDDSTSPSTREDKFKKMLGSYCPAGLTQKDFSKKNKHQTHCKPINNTINNAVSLRPDLKYSQLIDFIYQDGAEMTTI